MPQVFRTYKEAFNAAVLAARAAKAAGMPCDYGLSKASPYYGMGKDAYAIHRLPRPENRFGYEHRCQVVSADEPLMR